MAAAALAASSVVAAPSAPMVVAAMSVPYVVPVVVCASMGGGGMCARLAVVVLFASVASNGINATHAQGARAR